jgi:hypothetical protein
MKINLLTLKIKDDNFKSLKNICSDIFRETNEPSFNVIEPMLIIGKTHYNSLASIYVEAIKDSLIFDSKSSKVDNICLIKCTNKKIINNLRDKLCSAEDINFKTPYFNLLQNPNEYPIINLGNNYNRNIEVPQVIIKDYRLELIEIFSKGNQIIYKTLDSKHLSMDKVL